MSDAGGRTEGWRVDSRRLKVAVTIDSAVAVEAILRATIYNPDFDASIWSLRQGEEQ